jgi:hypothetical protein
MATKTKPFDVGTMVAKKAGGGTRIGRIIKTVGRKTWQVKFFDSEESETLKSSQLLHPKDPPAEATIQAVLPVLSDHDREGSDEGSDEGNDEVEELDGDAFDDDGDDCPGIDFLPDEEDDDGNNASYDDGRKPKPFDVGTTVVQRAGGGTRIGWIVTTVGRKTWQVKFFDSEESET